MNASISTQLKPDLEPYDIVHLFNITRVHETYIQMINARKQGKPVVCSAIYHDLEEYNRKGRYGLGRVLFCLVKDDSLFEYCRGLFNALRDGRQVIPIARQMIVGYRSQQEAVLRCADKIIVGSSCEKATLCSRFNGSAQIIDTHIVKVGIPRLHQESDPDSFEKKYGLENFILCVGRIEDLKNQLGLISAMQGIEIPVVLIGELNSNHWSYCRKVLKDVKRRDNF